MSAKSLRRLIKEEKKQEKEKKRRAKKEEKRRRATIQNNSLESFTSSGESFLNDLNEIKENGGLETMEESNQDRRKAMEERNNSLRLSELEDECEARPTDRSNPSHDSFHTSHEFSDSDEVSVSLEDILEKNQSQILVSDQFPDGISEMGTTATFDKTNLMRDDNIGTAQRTLDLNLPSNGHQTLPIAPEKDPKDEDSMKMKQSPIRRYESDLLPASSVKQSPIRRQESDLLPASSAQNASWFKSRGLMSRKSLKFLEKERRKKTKEKTNKPKPLIDLDDLSLDSDISGMDDQNESSDINGPIDDGDEEKKIDDTNIVVRDSAPTLISSQSSAQKVSFRQRVSEIDDDEELTLDELKEKMHAVIQVPMGYSGSDVSALDFNWKTSSRSLQEHWAKNGRGSNNENDSSSEDEDEMTPSQPLSLPLSSTKQSVGSDESDSDEDMGKIEMLYSVPSDVSGTGGQSSRRGSILRGNSQKTNSTSSEQKRVSWDTASSEPILEHNAKSQGGVEGLVEDSRRNSAPTPCQRSNLPPFGGQRPPILDQSGLAQDKGSQHSIGDKDIAPSEDKDTAPMPSSLTDDIKEERNRAFAELIQSVLESKTERTKVGLSPDEVTVLHKMLKRLSSQEGESINSADDTPHKHSSALFEEEAASVQKMKGNLNSVMTPITTNKSQSQAEMLAKVASEMSASLERSRSQRSKQETRIEENTAKKQAGQSKPVKNQILAKRPPLVEQPSPARKAYLQNEPANPVTIRDSKDANLIPGDDNKVRDATNSKNALQDLIQGNGKSSVFHAPTDDHTSELNIARTHCLDPPSYADLKDRPSSRKQQRQVPEALQLPNDVIRKKEAKKIRPIASTSASIESYEDILTLGINNLSVTMLVNIYGRLREMSLLGHASVMLRDIDVNSHQRNSRMKELRRLKLLKPEDENKGYLDTTLTAGYIVRAAIDEYEILESSPITDNGALSQVKKASLEYDATMVSDFKAWVAESLTKEFDGQCFEEGSVMRDLVDSSLEVVWISDRHPNDIHYCICVDRVASRVIVVFRGDESVLRRVKDSNMIEYENPLAEELGNTEFIRLRAAVSKNILNPRLDTKMSIVEEIHGRVNKIRGELTGRDPCHVTICGHNLGGGLATVTGFYLACNNNLKLASPIQIVTFASPRVGGREFYHSFQHLEDTGRLLYARFTNVNDMISLRPFWALSGSWKFEDWYKVSDMNLD